MVPINSEEERRWLAEAVERHMMVDVVSRMREIALLMSTPPAVLEAQGITHDDIEGMGSITLHDCQMHFPHLLLKFPEHAC